MELTVNGERRSLSGPLTVEELLRQMAVPATGSVAVLRNGEVLRRADWTGIVLQPEDELEIVRATVGG